MDNLVRIKKPCGVCGGKGHVEMTVKCTCGLTKKREKEDRQEKKFVGWFHDARLHKHSCPAYEEPLKEIWVIEDGTKDG